MNYKIYNDDCLKALDELEENSIDSIVTDPPYELNFMGKGWDNAGISFRKETWQKCLRVLKPGGYLLAFGGSRTFHRIAAAIEDAGFEIRDTIMYLYGSGFPKSMNIGLAIDKKNGVESKVIGKSKSGSTSKAFNLNEQQREAGTGILAGEYDLKEAQNEWNGWGTALKPSFEPIIVARKPFKGSLVDNVIKYGVGGINIDECRVETNDKVKMNIRDTSSCSDGWNRPWMENKEKDKLRQEIAIEKANNLGRFPANTILTYDETDFDEVCGGFPNTKTGNLKPHKRNIKEQNCYSDLGKYATTNHIGDSGSAARYFYCAKASKKDRDEGLDLKNIHPTVKPTNLMQYLIRLVTPKGGTVLDPFMGSGSTGKAVMFENKERQANYKFIGIEKEKEYCDIAEARIKWADDYKEPKENENQISIEDFIEEER